LATPNYGYEKRQRELAKKKKKEDKLRAKAANARQTAETAEGVADHSSQAPTDTPAAEGPAA